MVIISVVRTIHRGNAAEAAVLYALTAAEIPVLIPFGGGLAFDLAAVICDGTILRVQVKSGRMRKGCVEFNSSSTDHGRGQQHYRGRADVFAVHVESLDRIFVVPVDGCPQMRGFLRLEAPRNNQRVGVRFAEDHTFERWVAGLGHSAAPAAA